MIISRLIGGLGNQMFQYAAGRSLAVANNCELKLDISGFKDYTLHNGYELDLFNIKANVANAEDVSGMVNTQSRLMRFIYRKLKVKKSTHFVEQSFTFSSDFFNTEQPVYIDGYWQSYKYFESIESQLKQEFSFKSSLVGKNLQVYEHISNVNAVSIHVRRGDYVSNKHTNSVHGVCSLDYYRAAIQTMTAHVENPVFFIFSDDIEWVKDNLVFGSHDVFVDNNTGKKSYNDMCLMSLCQHHIIANSSFSWWGAWLGVNAKKIVIAPQQWFANTTITDDLIPESWLRI
jgi:hypothetical protein